MTSSHKLAASAADTAAGLASQSSPGPRNMQAIHARLAALEGESQGSGPVLVPWEHREDRRATTTIDGQQHVQGEEETLEQFLDRVTTQQGKAASRMAWRSRL